MEDYSLYDFDNCSSNFNISDDSLDKRNLSSGSGDLSTPSPLSSKKENHTPSKNHTPSDQSPLTLDGSPVFRGFAAPPNNDYYIYAGPSPAYEVFTFEQCEDYIQAKIEEVKIRIPGVPGPMARTLLAQFNWNPNSLIESYCSMESDLFFSKHHCVNPFVKVRKQQLTHCNCEICMETETEMDGLDCGHMYCLLCWDKYLTNEIIEHGNSMNLKCPCTECNIYVDDSIVQKLLTTSKAEHIFEIANLNNFVISHPLFRWCPSQGCEYIIRCFYQTQSKPAECDCGCLLCFDCGELWHEPIDCGMLKKWLAKVITNENVSKWPIVSVKHCPICDINIEKVIGCNATVCPVTTCQHLFCWLCLCPWSTHNNLWYNCNKYKPPNPLLTLSSIHLMNESTIRFKTYYKLFNEHMHSYFLEYNIQVIARSNMTILETDGWSWNDMEFIRDAIDTLYICRLALIFSYVFAYFIKECKEKRILEDYQQDLHKYVEELSHFLTWNIVGEHINDVEIGIFKKKVLDSASFCTSKRFGLLEEVRRGHNQHNWEFIN